MCGAKGYADNTGDGFTMLNVLDDATAVSYTHLDVYKRQPNGAAAGEP